MPQWVEILGWTLVHFLWQGSLVWLLFSLCSRLASDQSANVRYLLGLATLAAMAVIPVVTFLVLLAQPAGLPGGAVRQAVGQWSVVELSAMMPLAVLAWGGGVTWKLWQVVRDLMRVGAITQVGCRPLPAQWQQLVDELCAGFSISRPVRIMESILVQVPAAVGWLRPVVLIPSSALMGLSRQQLELIIAHELAHIRRFDYAVNLGQVMLETLFFFHPAVLSISRQVRAEREVCCDEMVVCSGGNRYQYARALTLLEDVRGLPAGSQAALAANGGQLLARIERLACDNHDRSDRLTGSLSLFTAGMAALGALVLVVLSGDSPSQQQVAPVAGASAPPDAALRVARQLPSTRPASQPKPGAKGIDESWQQSAAGKRLPPARPVGPPPLMRVALGAPSPLEPSALPVLRQHSVVWVDPAQEMLAIEAPSLSADQVVRPAMAVVDVDSTAQDSESAALALLSRTPVHRPPARSGHPSRGIRQVYALSDNDGGDLIFRVDPEYPSSARTRGMEASVTVDFAVNELGTVQDIQIIGNGITPGFRRSVKQAVALWKYSPLWRDGLPVTYRQTQTFNFRLMTPLRVAQGQSCIPHSNDTWACRSLDGVPN